VWQNRQFYFWVDTTSGCTPGDPGCTSTYGLCPDPAGLLACTGGPAYPQFSDLGVIGAIGALAGTDNLLTGFDILFVSEYFNGARSNVLQPEINTGIQVPAAFDEGGNFIRPGFGPLSLTGDYHILDGSLRRRHDAGGGLTIDFDSEVRPQGGHSTSAPTRSSNNHLPRTGPGRAAPGRVPGRGQDDETESEKTPKELPMSRSRLSERCPWRWPRPGSLAAGLGPGRQHPVPVRPQPGRRLPRRRHTGPPAGRYDEPNLAASLGVQCMHLSGGDGFVTMADGRPQYIFSFADLTGIPRRTSWRRALAAAFPAPAIRVDEGKKFYLTLTNVGMVIRPDLFDPHTVHFHGFPQSSTVFDGLPESGISINQGASLTYYYNLVEPGTFMYHCHVEATEHMQMGMLGNLYVRAARRTAPPGHLRRRRPVHPVRLQRRRRLHRVRRGVRAAARQLRPRLPRRQLDVQPLPFA
jgi:hypothetical protein